MPPPPPRKPAAKPKPSESFIGNDSSTMMTEETFEEFEARMKAEAESADEDEVDDTADGDEEDEEAAQQQLGPGGRPLDRFGVEWDYVSHEGMGFNDDEDEDAMSFEKNGKTYFKPDWGKLRPSEWVKYWTVNFALEAAQGDDDDDVYLAALLQHGFRNRNHWKRVQHTFLRHYGQDPEFVDAALEARQAGTRDAMKQAVKPGMLDPIEGVSIQQYAAIAAQQMSVTGPAFVKLLAKHKLDEAKFARVSEGWMARMSDQRDPMASAAIATEYAKGFAGGGVGPYGASAQEASESLGINDQVAGKSAKGASGSMTFEKFVEGPPKR